MISSWVISLPSIYTTSAYGSKTPSKKGICLSATIFIYESISFQHNTSDGRSPWRLYEQSVIVQKLIYLLFQHIPLEVQQLVSEKTGIPVAEIYGVVTFYSFFSLEPKGKYIIGCCLGTACYVKGAQQIIDKFSDLLGIRPGETTADGLFTIDALRCIGACGIAPAVTINGKVYPKMTVDAVAGIIETYRKKEAN